MSDGSTPEPVTDAARALPFALPHADRVYVLDDDGPVYRWRYQFVPRAF